MSLIDDALKKLNRPEYRQDTQRIVIVCFRHGVTLTLQQAEKIWQEYSESMAAGWMNLPESDDELWNLINFGMQYEKQ